MRNFKNAFGIIAFIAILLAVVTVVLAIEIFFLKLVGFTYDSWKTLAIFLVVFGIIEFIIVQLIDGIIKQKVKQNATFHFFWGHFLVSFLLMNIAVSQFDHITISTIGAVIYAAITAVLYIVMNRFSTGEQEHK